MPAFVEVARAGLTAPLLHPRRTAVALFCLLVVLTPFVSACAISAGLAADSERAIAAGPDLHVTGLRFGRDAPLPASAAAKLAAIEGVTSAEPRIVGPIALGKNREPAVLVGVRAQRPDPPLVGVEGRLFVDGPSHELVLGAGLAKRLGLRVGSVIPPFYYNPQGERVSRVVGTFLPSASIWESRVVLTSLETAAVVFNEEQTVTDVAIRCREGYVGTVREAIIALGLTGELGPGVLPRIVTRAELRASLPSGVSQQAAIFHLHYLLAMVAAALVLMVTSGIGLAEGRREIGVLKAVGWQTDEILLRGLVGTLVVSVVAASLAVLIAFVWLRGLNGWGIASVFLPGTDVAPEFPVPARLLPAPALLGFMFSWLITSLGTLSAAWRAALVPPREAMQ